MIKKFLFSLPLLMVLVFAHAQTEPYNWSFSAKKTAEGVYEIHCKATMQVSWHTYSQFTPAGGPVPTKFSFAKSPIYKLEGTVKEQGKMITRHEEVFGVDVRYFEGVADFIQLVKMKPGAKTNLSGTVTFMVCNDSECLPPKTQNFSVALN